MGDIFYGQIYAPEPLGLGQVIVEDGVITSVSTRSLVSKNTFCGGKDCIIAPGFIDLHIHGALKHDVIEGTKEAFKAVSEFEALSGVTAFLPTLLSFEREAMFSVVNNFSTLSLEAKGAIPLGINMEGPLLNREYHGAMDARYFCNGTHIRSLKEVLENKVVKFMTVAPETDGALDLIEFLHHRGISVGFGHSGATLEEGRLALSLGPASLTHIFNAMRPYHHREPGLVGLCFSSSRLKASVIADGEHLHLSAVDAIFRLKGRDGMYLISDATSGAGMSPGTYKLGAYELVVDETSSKLSGSKTLAGSVTGLSKAIKNFIKFTGASLFDAFTVASTTPASIIGDTTRGRIEIGKRADLVILSKELEVLFTIVGGKIVYSKVGS